MSDFIYSKKRVEQGKLSKEIVKIYSGDCPDTMEFHGEWGSLAVSKNLYDGFQPYETKEHICVVLGGPILCFQEKQYVGKNTNVAGTKAIYQRMMNDEIKWEDDLSGPFSILFINKQTAKVECVTDLMSFIPIFLYEGTDNIMLSSHVDVLARSSYEENNIDIISEVDFILHGTVTYPYTCYKNIKQIAPASRHKIESHHFITNSYWLPVEEVKYQSIHQAADELRNALQYYVQQIINEVDVIAHFISGGEDSRTLCGLISNDIKKDAFIFLDDMNREGQVAKKAAEAYGSAFHLSTRSKLHYLDILSNCTALVGKGSQYTHAHTFGFHKSCHLAHYPAVLGGLFADALLKGSRIKKIRGSSRFPFIPQVKKVSHSKAEPMQKVFKQDVLEELRRRRQSHLQYVKSFRKKSAQEWFELWPSSMNASIPNIYVNRRLFRSYEPFMSNDVVKISASVPQKWKLNRKLFHKAAKPLLEPTKWLFHGDGRLPYFPWYINSCIQFWVWCYRQIGTRLGMMKGNQGSWGEWNVVINSPEWEQAINKYLDGSKVLNDVLVEKDVKELIRGKYLNRTQKINLLQSMYSNSDNVT